MGIIEIHTGPHQATPAHTVPHRATPSQKNALYTHTEPHRATPPQCGSRNTHRATPSHTESHQPRKIFWLCFNNKYAQYPLFSLHKTSFEHD